MAGTHWIAQNIHKTYAGTQTPTRWASLARGGHQVSWEFHNGGGYTGRVQVDGMIMSKIAAIGRFFGGGKRQ